MSKPVKISTVLTRAAKYIDEHGLAKGDFFKYKNGRSVLNHTVTRLPDAARIAAEKGCSACALGALYISDLEAIVPDDLDNDLFYARNNEASKYVQKVVDRIIVPAWNDERERTKDEVVQALKDAAKAARKDGK